MTSQDPYLQQIGERIRRARRDRGWSQRALADAAVGHGTPTVHRQEISAMENGRFAGSVRKLQAVLRALRLTLAAEVVERPTVDDLDQIFGDG